MSSDNTRSDAGRRVQIAGAGLSGLTAGVLLARRGWEVHVHERAESLREIGAGIFVWENAIRALEDAGREIRRSVTAIASWPGRCTTSAAERCRVAGCARRPCACTPSFAPIYIGPWPTRHDRQVRRSSATQPLSVPPRTESYR